MMYADADVRMWRGGQPDAEQKWTRGRVLKNHQIFADILYGRPLTMSVTKDSTVAAMAGAKSKVAFRHAQ